MSKVNVEIVKGTEKEVVKNFANLLNRYKSLDYLYTYGVLFGLIISNENRKLIKLENFQIQIIDTKNQIRIFDNNEKIFMIITYDNYDEIEVKKEIIKKSEDYLRSKEILDKYEKQIKVINVNKTKEKYVKILKDNNYIRLISKSDIDRFVFINTINYNKFNISFEINYNNNEILIKTETAKQNKEIIKKLYTILEDWNIIHNSNKIDLSNINKVDGKLLNHEMLCKIHKSIVWGNISNDENIFRAYYIDPSDNTNLISTNIIIIDIAFISNNMLSYIINSNKEYDSIDDLLNDL